MSPMENAIAAVEQTTAFYIKDLEVRTDEQLMQSAGGTARKAIDFSYEVGEVLLAFVARLKGLEPTPSPSGDDWAVAPEELKSKTAIIEYITTAANELVATAKAIPADEIDKLVGAPGRQRPAWALVQFGATHTMYHDAQLNFIQSLNGDIKMHWF